MGVKQRRNHVEKGSLVLRKINDTAIVSNSAAGTASHTPATPISLGSVINNIVISPKVRRKDRIADRFPSDNAVNAAEVKIFKPQNRKLNEKIGKPLRAIS